METQAAQILPNDIDAERSCLGCMLLSGDCIAPVFERIKNKDYFTAPITRSFTKLLARFSMPENR